MAKAGGEADASKSKPREFAYEGSACKIAYAKKLDGSQPAKEYYEACQAVVKAKFLAVFQQVGSSRTFSNEDKFRIIRDSKVKWAPAGGRVQDYVVGEFKVHEGPGYRIMACKAGNEWVMTHGFKKGAKVPVQVERAENILVEDLERAAKLR